MCKQLIFLVSFVLVLGLVLTSVTKAADPDLVGWWKLDDGSGTTAIDSSGNGNDGTLTAGTAGFPEWKTTGDDFWVGTGALEFHGGAASGEGDLVDCGNSTIFDITENITFALWVKIDAFTMTYQYVFSKGHNYMILRAADTPYLRVVFNGLSTGDGDDYYAGGTTIPIDDGQWHHVAASYDSSTGIVAFYTDGILEESKTTSGSIPVNTESLCIGRRNQSNRKGTDAIIDDVRIYNRALTEAEILAAMEGAGGFPYALGPNPADGAYYEDTWVNLSWRPGYFAVSHDVYFGDNFNDVNDGSASTFQGNQTDTFIVVGFPGFSFPDGLIPGTTYYWRIDEVNDTEPNSPWVGSVWSFSIPPKTAYNPDPADGAESVDLNANLSWTTGFGAKLHTVYFGDNFDDVNNATVGLPQGTTTFSPGPLELAKNYYWRVDEFDGIDTYKGEVWSFITQGAVGNPEPANGAVDVTQSPILTWMHGVFANSHQVYFGTDKDAVKNADTSSPEYKGIGALGSESYNPGKLQWYSTYYWRIDEVNNVNPDSPWTGSLWSFTTVDFIVIEDFEDYNDYPPDEIFNTWIDGYGTTTNGSTAGYAEPDFLAGEHYVETTIVHGGGQSMPLFYDNNFKYSEATMTLTQRNWTEEGVGELSLWFYGDADNAAERMYVSLNGSAVVYHDNPDAAQIAKWTQWTIDLQDFAAQSVNLANVNTITIGFGDKNNLQAGGSGMVFFDDIRLYRPAQ